MQQKQTKKFRKINLGDCLSLLTDYHANGSYKLLKKNVRLLDKPDYAIMIRTTNFEKQDFKSDLKYISKNAYEFLKKSKVKSNDILMNKIANAGSVYLMPDLGKPVSLAMNLFLLRTNRNLVDQRFVYYYLKANEKYVKLFAIGTAAKTINKTSVRNLKIFLPDLKNQKKVASILSAYDDLIENNNRRIEFLEEIAQAIYKEWFVRLRFPGHEEVKMVDSELGKIPEGWKVNFEDHVNFLEGPGLRSYQYREKGIPFLNIRTLNNNEINLSKVKYIDEKEVKDHYSHFLLSENDHVVSSSGTIGRIVTIRKVHLPLLLNTSIIRMRPRTNKIGKWLLKHFLKSKYFQEQIKAYAIGSAQINYGPSHLKKMWLLLPSKNISKKYEEIVDPLEENIKNILDKNLLLKETRDILLPKLISGKIDVSDLNINVEDIK